MNKKIVTCFAAVEQTDAMLEEEIKRSNAICVVYAVDDEDSLDSVTDHWLPLIRKTLQGQEKRAQPPIVLVGNKVRGCGGSIESSICTHALEFSCTVTLCSGDFVGGLGGVLHHGPRHAHHERVRGD